MNWYKSIIKQSSIIPEFNDYESFKKYYLSLLKEMFRYKHNEVGSQVFAEKLGELVDKYLGYEVMIDEEQDLK
jgi:hypothetical protein